MKQILEQQIKYDEKGCYRITQFEDGEILHELISSEEAARLQEY